MKVLDEYIEAMVCGLVSCLQFCLWSRNIVGPVGIAPKRLKCLFVLSFKCSVVALFEICLGIFQTTLFNYFVLHVNEVQKAASKEFLHERVILNYVSHLQWIWISHLIWILYAESDGKQIRITKKEYYDGVFLSCHVCTSEWIHTL